jgi:hypothetical protein
MKERLDSEIMTYNKKNAGSTDSFTGLTNSMYSLFFIDGHIDN